MRTFLILVVCGWALCPLTAAAQHNHSEGHPDYLSWESKKTTNCCSDQDCGDLNENEIRETATGTEVWVTSASEATGRFCPVQPEHYLTKGRSPDWNKPHACINHKGNYGNPCDALLCFVPKGGW